MKSVFVDSSGFFAHLVAADLCHARALSLFQQAKVERWRLVSTNAVLFETYALLLYRTRNGRTNALAFLDSIERGFCSIERLSTQDDAKVRTLVRAHEDKMYSLCDAASFVVMERLVFMKQSLLTDISVSMDDSLFCKPLRFVVRR